MPRCRACMPRRAPASAPGPATQPLALNPRSSRWRAGLEGGREGRGSWGGVRPCGGQGWRGTLRGTESATTRTHPRPRHLRRQSAGGSTMQHARAPSSSRATQQQHPSPGHAAHPPRLPRVRALRSFASSLTPQPPPVPCAAGDPAAAPAAAPPAATAAVAACSCFLRCRRLACLLLPAAAPAAAAAADPAGATDACATSCGGGAAGVAGSAAAPSFAAL